MFRKAGKKWMISLFRKHGMMNPVNKNFQFWQNENHPVLLNNPVIFQQKVDYVHQNPVRAGLVDEPQHYVYSSAHPLCPVKLNEW